jgi:hypothetical protein
VSERSERTSITVSTRSRTRRGLIAGIVLALVVINSVGLCVTYGVAEIAW